MATDHQKESVSIIDLTDGSLNESIALNQNDKHVVPLDGNQNRKDKNESNTSSTNDEQIVPYNGNKNERDGNIVAHSSNLSIRNDNSTLTSDIGNPDVMGNISSRLAGETLFVVIPM